MSTFLEVAGMLLWVMVLDGFGEGRAALSPQGNDFRGRQNGALANGFRCVLRITCSPICGARQKAALGSGF